eukprot:scaffold24450_cov57-Phaeocystis_antarctica.AAC.4
MVMPTRPPRMVPPPMIESQPDPSGAPLPSFAALSSTTPSAGTLGASTARHMRVRIGSPVRLYFPAGTKVTALQQRPLASLSAAVRALALAGSLQLKCAPPRVATSAHLVRVRLRDRVRVGVRVRVRVRVRAHVLLRAVSASSVYLVLLTMRPSSALKSAGLKIRVRVGVRARVGARGRVRVRARVRVTVGVHLEVGGAEGVDDVL